MVISGINSFSQAAQQPMAGLDHDQVAGASRLANALQPGYSSVQNALETLMQELDAGRSTMSELEKAALQRQVSHMSATVTLAMNVSLGIGKACEKLQQA